MNALFLSSTQLVSIEHTSPSTHSEGAPVHQHWIKQNWSQRTLFIGERNRVNVLNTRKDSMTDCLWKVNSHQITKRMLCLYQTVNVFLRTPNGFEQCVVVCTLYMHVW